MSRRQFGRGTVSWWKANDRRSNLVRAAALILAEIERLDRSPSTSRAIVRAAAEISRTLA
jgi:hypothetical protein